MGDTPSRARVLVEIERRYGQVGSIESSLFGAFLLDGGDRTSDAAFEAWLDRQDDIGALVDQVEAILNSPTGPAPTSEPVPGSSSPASPEPGTSTP